MNNHKPILYVDDDRESVGILLKLRAPALFIGLVLGIGMTFIASDFEEVLSRNVQIAFFLPFVIYIAGAIGTQTESIYARDLKTGKAKFKNYLGKELALGVIFGLTFGAITGLMAFLWLKNNLLSISVALSTFIAITMSPLVALLVTQIFQMSGRDPAAGSGPITTVIQDVASVVIYGIVASAIML